MKRQKPRAVANLGWTPSLQGSTPCPTKGSLNWYYLKTSIVSILILTRNPSKNAKKNFSFGLLFLPYIHTQKKNTPCTHGQTHSRIERRTYKHKQSCSHQKTHKYTHTHRKNTLTHIAKKTYRRAHTRTPHKQTKTLKHTDRYIQADAHTDTHADRHKNTTSNSQNHLRSREIRFCGTLSPSFSTAVIFMELFRYVTQHCRVQLITRIGAP